MDEHRWLTVDLFQGRVGERFEVRADIGDPVEVELVEATEGTEPGGPGPEGQQRRQFSLVFRGPVERALQQATYRLDHADLGEVELFLVPIGPDSEGLRYEAAFA